MTPNDETTLEAVSMEPTAPAIEVAGDVTKPDKKAQTAERAALKEADRQLTAFKEEARKVMDDLGGQRNPSRETAENLLHRAMVKRSSKLQEKNAARLEFLKNYERHYRDRLPDLDKPTEAPGAEANRAYVREARDGEERQKRLDAVLSSREPAVLRSLFDPTVAPQAAGFPNEEMRRRKMREVLTEIDRDAVESIDAAQAGRRNIRKAMERFERTAPEVVQAALREFESWSE